jgi:hypothetical protein
MNFPTFPNFSTSIPIGRNQDFGENITVIDEFCTIKERVL